MAIIEADGDNLIFWNYPEIYGAAEPVDRLRIALVHVRAAKDLIVSFDSDRDGWVVAVEKTFDDAFGGSCEGFDPPVFVEVAFVSAWCHHATLQETKGPEATRCEAAAREDSEDRKDIPGSDSSESG